MICYKVLRYLDEAAHTATLNKNHQNWLLNTTQNLVLSKQRTLESIEHVFLSSSMKSKTQLVDGNIIYSGVPSRCQAAPSAVGC